VGGGGGTTHQELHESDLRRLIREAGRTPVERDTLYREIRRDQPANVATAQPALA
jgi:aminodeoxyfutalosine synthase